MEEEKKHRFINGLDVDAKLMENTLIPDDDRDLLSLVDLYVAIERGRVKRDDVPYHFMVLLARVEPELYRTFKPKVRGSPSIVNGIDIHSPFIENTFFPNYGATLLSMWDIYMVLHYSGYAIDDLPEGARAIYEGMLPKLEKMGIHR